MWQRSVAVKIRFINRVDSGAPFLRDLLPYMDQQGHEVEVLVSDVSYRSGNASLGEVLADTQVHLNTVPTYADGQGLLAKLRSFISFILGAMVATLRGRDVDVNFFLTQPPLFFLWGLFLKSLRRQPYMVIVMDLYPDVAIQSGLMNRNHLLARTLTWLNRLALRRALAVCVIGRCMQHKVAALGVEPTRIHRATLWANDKLVYPVAREDNLLRRELQLDEAFIVLYSGNIGVGHYFDDILEVAHRLRDEPDLRFVFIGHGARHGEIEAAKATQKLDNVLLLPFQPEDRLAHSLSLGDVHFLSLRAGFTGLMVPSKAYGIFTAGRAAIYQGEAWGEIAQEIEEYEMGSVVPLNDADSLEQTILNYYQDRELAQQHGQQALARARSNLGRAQSVARYADLLASIVEPQTAPREASL